MNLVKDTSIFQSNHNSFRNDFVFVVDKACQLGLGHAMGPFKSQDIVNGIPVGLHSLDYMRDELGECYRPCPTWRRKVEAGELGVKTGKGFYDYSQQE